MPDDLRERAALVALLRHTRGSWPQLACDVLEHGSAVAVLDGVVADRDTLFADLERTDKMIKDAAAELQAWQGAGLEVHTVMDGSYPPQLREIRELPPVIFTRGRLQADTRAVAVVGSRRASARGLEIAAMVSRTLASRQITVVSGLAAGIDTAAHTAALDAGGRTVAVIGTGMRRCYPASNRALQDRIADSGLVLSQFWPDAPPRKEHFPMRNAVMSGYAAATFVVEAGERSGARNQARLALQHGRPVLLLADLLRHEWAQALAGQPGVTVVSQPAELFDAVDILLQRRSAELSPWEESTGFAVA